MTRERARPEGPDALLYLPEDGDLAAACAPVAGLPLGFRALMIALRAGCGRVGVPAAFRQTAVEHAIARSPVARCAAVWVDGGALPAASGAVLLMPATVVLPPPSLVPLLAAPAPAVLVGAPAAAPLALVPAAEAARVATAGGAAGRAIRERLPALGARPVTGSWCIAATDGPARREAERRLRADLGSAIDTRFDTAVHRPCSRRVTWLALRLGLHANTVSLAGLLLGLAAAVSLAWPTMGAALLGAILYFASVVLDHSDGEVARLSFTQSRLGEWLDVSIDTIVHAACALALGIAAQQAAEWGLWAGIGAAAGFVASAFAAKTAPARGSAGAPGPMLAAVGTRDGFYVLLGLHLIAVNAAPQAVPYLVALAGIGSHAFWITSVLRRRWPRPVPAEMAAARSVEPGG